MHFLRIVYLVKENFDLKSAQYDKWDWMCERTVVFSESVSRFLCNMFYLKKNSGNILQWSAEDRAAWRNVRLAKILLTQDPVWNSVFGLI